MCVRQTSAPHTHFASLSPAHICIYIYLSHSIASNVLTVCRAHVLCVECAQLSCGCPSIRSCYQSFSLIIYLLLFVVGNSAFRFGLFRAPNQTTLEQLWIVMLIDWGHNWADKIEKERGLTHAALRGESRKFENTKSKKKCAIAWCFQIDCFQGEWTSEWSRLIVCITLRIHVRAGIRVRPTRQIIMHFNLN